MLPRLVENLSGGWFCRIHCRLGCAGPRKVCSHFEMSNVKFSAYFSSRFCWVPLVLLLGFSRISGMPEQLLHTYNPVLSRRISILVSRGETNVFIYFQNNKKPR